MTRMRDAYTRQSRINWFDWESATGFGLEVVQSFASVGVAQQTIARRAPNRSALTTC